MQHYRAASKPDWGELTVIVQNLSYRTVSVTTFDNTKHGKLPA